MALQMAQRKMIVKLLVHLNKWLVKTAPIEVLQSDLVAQREYAGSGLTISTP